MSRSTLAYKASEVSMQIQQVPCVIPMVSVCNNHCRFCNLNESGEGARISSVEQDWRTALLESREGRRRGVVFVGAEPTLSEELPEAIGTARELGFDSIGVQTNGRR